MLTNKIKRLSKAGCDLYIQFDRRELDRRVPGACEPIQLNGKCQVRGLVRTKGTACWLGPASGFANQEITRRLRAEGLAHGSHVQATVVRQAGPEAARHPAGGRSEGQP